MKSMGRIALLMASIGILLFACKQPKTQLPFLDRSNWDTTIRPQDDFFSFANGGWIATAEIPASESRWGSFNILQDKATADINSLLEELCHGKRYKTGTAEQLIADLYNSAMDSAQMERLGLLPLQAELDRVQSLSTPDEILPEICHEIRTGMVPLRYGIVPDHLITFYVYQDSKKSDQQVAQFEQGSLGLPNKDYYVKTDSSSTRIQEQYRQYIHRLLVLAGADTVQARQQAVSIYALEAKLAQASRTPVELRDPILNYNSFSVSVLDSSMKNLNWRVVLKNLGVQTDTVLVGQPDYYVTLNTLLFSEPLDNWKNLLRYRIIRSNASLLSHNFVQTNFSFYGTVLYGDKEMKPRWKRMTTMINSELGDALGKLYVERYFPSQAKERMDTLVSNLLTAYAERIQATTWMSDTTKVRAMEKLHRITRKIGYPNHWKNYEGLVIERNQYFSNVVRTRQFAYNEMTARLGQPVDREAWLMTAPTVNAYYSPNNNEIVFPAGILQPPFFNYDADDAINYGAIGMVIAHEITHGFDDKRAGSLMPGAI